MDTLGRHVIAELDGCDPAALSDPASIRRLLAEAAKAAGATRLTDEVFGFGNGGVSGFILLAESHISVHTWPEHAYAAVDAYTCGRHAQPELACHYLAEHLGGALLHMSTVERGRPAAGGGHEHTQVSSLMWGGVDSHRSTGARLRVDSGHEHHPVRPERRSAIPRNP